MPHSTDELTTRLSEALRGGDFESARTLVLEYRECASARVRCSKSFEQQARLIKHQVDQLTEWLHLARVVRSHLAATLGTAVAQSSYILQHHEKHTIQVAG